MIYGTRGLWKAKIPFELLSQIHAFNSHRPSPSELFLQTSASPAKPAGAADERLSGTTYSTALVNINVDVAVSFGPGDVVILGSRATGLGQLLVRGGRQVVWGGHNCGF